MIRESIGNFLSNERHRLPLFIPVGVGLGIYLYFAQSGPTPLFPYVIGLMLVSMLFRFAGRNAGLLLALGITFALLAGGAASSLRLALVEAPVLREPIYFKPVEGTIEDIQYKENKTRLILRAPVIDTLAPEHTPKRVSVTYKTLETPLRIGERIRMQAMLMPPPAPSMPGAYDFARMFYFDQLGAVGFSVKQPEIISPSPVGGGSGWGHPRSDTANNAPLPTSPLRWEERITTLRLNIADHLVASMGERTGSIAAALMVGEQSRVPADISDSMRASGIYHILSISGLHMTLACGLIFFAIRLALAMIPYTAIHWPTKKIAAVGGLIGGAGYLILAGAPVPAIRSYIMVASVLTAILIDRKGISMFSLGWAATAILLIMPESLFSASFQLSFAATLAIVALYERWGHVFFHSHASVPGRVFLYFLGLMLTSLAATLYTTPLAIVHFNRMALFGILTNMLVVPLSSFWIMPVAMLSFLAMPLGWEAPFLWLLKHGLELMMKGSDWVASFPYATIAVPPPTALGFVLLVIGGLWFALFLSRIRYAGIALAALGLLTIAQFKPYDLLISDNARRIAYRAPGGDWVMIRGNVASFEAEMWLRSQGSETMLTRSRARLVMPELRCDKTTCLIERENKNIVAAIRKDAGDLCESGMEMVIAPYDLDCDTIPHVIDRDFTAQHGAVGVRFPDLSIDTAERVRGHWPWTKEPLVEDEDGVITEP